MPKPRYSQISPESTPYIHCVSRCVRRSFLCGDDPLSGRNFDHRKQWVEDEILRLGQIFALDVTAYAVMSNHFHVVLHINSDTAMRWTDRQVIERWHQLFNGTLQSQRFLAGVELDTVSETLLQQQTEQWRQRLFDISWFMRVLNEKIAREANKEDGCTGRFWEGRFKSQALLDEKALLACMAYVDLNPVRAGVAKTPEHSRHTSVEKRCRAAKSQGRTAGIKAKQPVALQPFTGSPRNQIADGLPFRLCDYLELVDWTGRAIRDDKRGHIDKDLPAILTRLDMDPEHWLYLTQNFDSSFKSFVGSAYTLKRVCRNLGYLRTPGLSMADALF